MTVSKPNDKALGWVEDQDDHQEDHDVDDHLPPSLIPMQSFASNSAMEPHHLQNPACAQHYTMTADSLFLPKAVLLSSTGP